MKDAEEMGISSLHRLKEEGNSFSESIKNCNCMCRKIKVQLTHNFTFRFKAKSFVFDKESFSLFNPSIVSLAICSNWRVFIAFQRSPQI